MTNLVLIDLIKRFRAGDMTTFNSIYEIFKGLIIFYSRRLKYEDAMQDLTVYLVELLYSIDLSVFVTDESNGLKRYIAVAIRNQYIMFSKYHQKTLLWRNCLYENNAFCNVSMEEQLYICEALKELTVRQRKVIIYRYFYNYSDIEIAQMLGISRQSVNRLTLRGIEILKRFYCM